MAQRSEDDDDTYDCKSFTDNYIWYEIELKNGHLFRCNCPDNSKLCKHIFLINRVADAPYTLRSDIVVDADTTGLAMKNLRTNFDHAVKNFLDNPALANTHMDQNPFSKITTDDDAHIQDDYRICPLSISKIIRKDPLAETKCIIKQKLDDSMIKVSN
ncbi:hypothetical protein BCV72DRAFT_334518 [Rhizopus microsporus var. microsporus]|uniref:SWIM-type domain-containing protein n=1 Tax=Rhizopus microsporus var. microsporus TaxID=86635 RepID=A0A1X0R8L2_RHIZD|nr:hypothetical protein BCV72DRAFT_334518 [Rhizopus microsporus var. microsporus]